MRNLFLFFTITTSISLACCNQLQTDFSGHIKYSIYSTFTIDTLNQIKIEPLHNFTKAKEKSNIEKVILFKNDERGIELSQSTEDSSIFLMDDIAFSPLDQISIRISITGKKDIYACDTLPPSCPSFTNINNEIIEVRDPGEKNGTYFNSGSIRIESGENISGYYELELWIKEYSNYAKEEFYKCQHIRSLSEQVTSEDYYPEAGSIDKDYPKSLIFSIENGNIPHTINFMYLVTRTTNNEGTELSKHDLRVVLKKISPSYYHFMKQYYLQRNAITGDLIFGPTPPVIIKGNVENATGLFAAYTASQKTISIDSFNVIAE